MWRQVGNLPNPLRIPLDHVGQKRRGLLPEIVERGGELAVEGVRARRLADEVPLHARDEGRPREVARPHHDDPARRVGDPPRLRVKRVGPATEFFQFDEPGLERNSGAFHPADEQPQGIRRRDPEVVAHEQPDPGPRGDRTKKPLANVVEAGGLNERREQVDLARAWEPVGEPRPEGAIGAGGEREPGAAL